MTPDEAKSRAQDALAAGNYTVRDHFYERMKLRGMFWPDVQEVIANPSNVRTDGTDQFDRERWFFKGITTAQSQVEILVTFDEDGDGTIIFWTLYWEN